MKLLKYCTDWKAVYIIWILSSIFISKPLPYYDEFLLKQYEIFMVDYWSIYNKHGYISYHSKELDAKPTFVATVYSS